jgi:hypothetical protein
LLLTRLDGYQRRRYAVGESLQAVAGRITW